MQRCLGRSDLLLRGRDELVHPTEFAGNFLRLVRGGSTQSANCSSEVFCTQRHQHETCTLHAAKPPPMQHAVLPPI